MNIEHILVITTAPSDKIAHDLANELVNQKVAACVNILTGVNSIYTWKGEVNNDKEIILLIKTTANHFYEGVIPVINSIHPYEVPEIIGIPILFGSKEYLNWIDEVVS